MLRFIPFRSFVLHSYTHPTTTMLPLAGFFERLQQMANVPQSFNVTYRAFPVACTSKTPAAQAAIEQGDKIVMPASALDTLAQLKVTYPMMFELRSKRTQQRTHCGVMEFSAEEGIAYLPYWMMENLGLESGAMIDVRNVTLPKGTFVRLQPHTTKFTELANPRVVLERALRSFSCLTRGDTIAIRHNNTVFHLDIVEVKPGDAISIYETDVQVDFKEPKDYKEYTKKLQKSADSTDKPSDSSTASSASSVNAATDSAKQRASSHSSAASSIASKAASVITKDMKTSSSHSDDAGWGGTTSTTGTAYHPTTSSHTASTASSASTSANSSPAASSAGGSNYFSQFKGGYRLNDKKSTAKTTNGSPMNGPSTPQPSSTSSTAASSMMRTPPSTAPPTAASSSSSSSSSPSGERIIRRNGNFEYIYQKTADGKEKLLRRIPIATKQASSFKPFEGSGNKLK